jgi:hypothetical protein
MKGGDVLAMRFREIAWGAVVYACSNRNTQGEAIYDSLVGDKAFLERLQQAPSLDDFERVRNFLVHFGVRFAPKTLPHEYLSIWPYLKSDLSLFSKERLETCDLSNSSIKSAIKSIYDYLLRSTWGGATVISKTLHFFNVYLFVMWDGAIQSAYGKSGEPSAYLEFLEAVQIQAKEVTDDFKQFSLPGSTESFLSQKLGYRITRPLTKFLDEYNWMTITRKWPPIPPDWLLELYLTG